MLPTITLAISNDFFFVAFKRMSALSLDFTGLDWVLTGSSGLNWVKLGSNGLEWVIIGKTGLDWVAMG